MSKIHFRNTIIKFMSFFIINSKKRKQFRKKHSIQNSVLSNNGQNNKLVILDNEGNITGKDYIENLKIIFNGSNNVVTLYETTKFTVPLVLKLESGNDVFFGKNTILRLDVTGPMKFCKLHIGHRCSSNGTSIQIHDEQGLVVDIGNEVMFSFNTIVRPSDGHTIYEVNSLNILNYPSPIIIGNHCWIGMQSTILKGCNIPPNSIVAAGSICTAGLDKGIEQNKNVENAGYIFAGIPAKIVREGVNWSVKNTDNFRMEKAC